MIFYTIAIIAALLLWWCGTYLLWHIPLCSGVRDAEAAEGLTVIIPARNEEHNLPKLLQSLVPQLTCSDKILVINDHSVDATAVVARDNGATVLQSTDRPEGWTGKTWACWQGAQAAETELLLFVDADTWFANGALGRIVATRQQHGGLVSVQPFHCLRKPYERLSMLFNLMVMIGVDAFSMRARRRPPGGSFGPCLLCSRKDYFTVGGHKAVRKTVLENLALGPLFQKEGISVSCFGGRDTLFYRMYPHGFHELIEGWTKGFATGAANTPPVIMVLTVGWITGAFIAAISLGVSFCSMSIPIPVVAIIVYMLYCIQLYWMVRRIGDFGMIASVLFPVHLLFFAWLYLRSFIAIFIRKKIRWKGRDIPV